MICGRARFVIDLNTRDVGIRQDSERTLTSPVRRVKLRPKGHKSVEYLMPSTGNEFCNDHGIAAKPWWIHVSLAVH